MTRTLRFNSWHQQRFNLSPVYGLIPRHTYSPAQCSPKDKVPRPLVVKDPHCVDKVRNELSRISRPALGLGDVVLNQSWGQLCISVSP